MIAGFESALPGVAGLVLLVALVAILGLAVEWAWERDS